MHTYTCTYVHTQALESGSARVGLVFCVPKQSEWILLFAPRREELQELLGALSLSLSFFPPFVSKSNFLPTKQGERESELVLSSTGHSLNKEKGRSNGKK
jgi:hypothetical protein